MANINNLALTFPPDLPVETNAHRDVPVPNPYNMILVIKEINILFVTKLLKEYEFTIQAVFISITLWNAN